MTQHQAPEAASVVVPLGIWNAVVDAAQAYADFAAAREAMNAARPAISATYKAYHEAERKHWTTAISLAQVAEQIVAASTDDTRTTQPLSLTVDEARIAEREACAMVAENISCGIDINLSLSMTKKEHGAYACHQIAAAIRARS